MNSGSYHIQLGGLCQDKTYGGLGIKDLEAWNQALIAKQAWAIEKKVDVLWVKWVHERYLKGKQWWDYQDPYDCCQYWKKNAL